MDLPGPNRIRPNPSAAKAPDLAQPGWPERIPGAGGKTFLELWLQCLPSRLRRAAWGAAFNAGSFLPLQDTSPPPRPCVPGHQSSGWWVVASGLDHSLGTRGRQATVCVPCPKLTLPSKTTHLWIPACWGVTA